MFRRDKTDKTDKTARTPKPVRAPGVLYHGSFNRLEDDAELLPAVSVPPSLLREDHPLVMDRAAALASPDAWRFERVWLSRTPEEAARFAPGGFVYAVSQASVIDHGDEYATQFARVLREVAPTS